MFDLNGNCVMIGLRTLDNCYVVCHNENKFKNLEDKIFYIYTKQNIYLLLSYRFK